MTAPLYVVADVHGHRMELHAELRAAGLTDAAGHWSGGEGRLWFLGDYVDRGPDGIGVIDDIRRLTGEAAAAGGEVHALLGNHELQLLGAHRFGTSPVPSWSGPDGLYGAWRRWGGLDSDLRRLTDSHLAWLSGLPAVAVVDGFLLLHADTVRYLEFGDSVPAVNAAVAARMATTDPDEWLDFAGRISHRMSFRGGDGEDAIDRMLATLGGRRIVHGHSTLISFFGVLPGQVTEAVSYADGRVLAVDGGAYEGGRILVTRLA